SSARCDRNGMRLLSSSSAAGSSTSSRCAGLAMLVLGVVGRVGRGSPGAFDGLTLRDRARRPPDQTAVLVVVMVGMRAVLVGIVLVRIVRIGLASGRRQGQRSGCTLSQR